MANIAETGQGQILPCMMDIVLDPEASPGDVGKLCQPGCSFTRELVVRTVESGPYDIEQADMIREALNMICGRRRRETIDLEAAYRAQDAEDR